MSSSIPPNILGSIAQSQISAREVNKNENAERNKKADATRKLNQTHTQKQSEVEESGQTEDLVVHSEDQRRRDGQDARDTYEFHQQMEEQGEGLYHPDGRLHRAETGDADVSPPMNPAGKAAEPTGEDVGAAESTNDTSGDDTDDPGPGHIDLSA